MMAETVVRRGEVGDIEPAFAVWWAAETARRGGPPPRVSEERVRGYARRARASLFVAEGGQAGGVVGMALLTPATSRPDDISVLQMVFVSLKRWSEGVGGRLHRLRHTVWHTVRAAWFDPKMTDRRRYVSTKSTELRFKVLLTEGDARARFYREGFDGFATPSPSRPR
jgi:hypothetical protein